MPSSMLHLIVAKKVEPNGSIDWYIGNIAADAIRDRKQKDEAHFENHPNIEAALKEFAQKADNDYLKGILLHLYTDWKWKTTYLVDFINKTEGRWYPQYAEEIGKLTAYAFHNTEWAQKLWEQMEQCDEFGFRETTFIMEKEGVKEMIRAQKRWQTENKTGPSEAFPPTLIETFANKTAAEFILWCNEIFESRN